MGKSVKKIAAVAAPVAGFALGGPVGAAIGGGLGGAISGEGLGGIAKGAALGGAFGAAPGLAGSAGLGTLGTSALTSGIQGAALGGIGGGTQGALLGAGLGGLGGAISGGALGTVAGTPLSGGLQGPTQGSGILGGVTKNLGGLGQLASPIATGGQPMKLGSLLNAGGKLFSYAQGSDDLEDIQNMLARQSAAASQQFQPYAQAGQQALANMQAPSMEALQNDPGYQFRLQQGNQALERSLAARGLGSSGAALKAAQEYGQGLADQTYNNYFNRQSQLAGLGYGAAGGLGSIATNLGNVQAAAELERINQRNQLLGGLGSIFG